MKLIKLREFIKEDTIVSRSPGRINFIGEHTDYNEGFVLPAAIDRVIYVALTPRHDDEVRLHSLDLGETYNTTIHKIEIAPLMWANYILGVADQFVLAGAKMKGFELAFTGEIPMGGGLSSSAAIECSVAMALNQYLECKFDKLKLAHMSRQAEHKFTGVKCGIMDQFASIFGMADKVIKLDCRSLEYEYLDFNHRGIKIVLYDSNVKHSLASSEYNLRHQQCFEGVALVAKHVPTVKSLRDVNMEMLHLYVQKENPLVYKRCRYVIEENIRLHHACEDLKNNDLIAFGQKMYETHTGLSELYEVSCPELDFIVGRLKEYKSVLGSRMMGGGFGGCTINLIKEDDYYEITNTITHAYHDSMNKELTTYEVKISNGSTYLQKD